MGNLIDRCSYLYEMDKPAGSFTKLHYTFAGECSLAASLPSYTTCGCNSFYSAYLSILHGLFKSM